jgi:hypothetical protein
VEIKPDDLVVRQSAMFSVRLNSLNIIFQARFNFMERFDSHFSFFVLPTFRRTTGYRFRKTRKGLWHPDVREEAMLCIMTPKPIDV